MKEKGKKRRLHKFIRYYNELDPIEQEGVLTLLNATEDDFDPQKPLTPERLIDLYTDADSRRQKELLKIMEAAVDGTEEN